MSSRPFIVAIDGPAGAGKSTVSRLLARRLGFALVDTGAIYRCVALQARAAGIALDDDVRLAPLLESIHIGFRMVDGENHVFLDGRDVSAEIRTPEVSMAASAVSARAVVRSGLLELQRRLALEAELGAQTIAGVTVIVQNAASYTYFGNHPVEMGEGATLHSGDLAGVVLDRARPLDVPTIIARALSRHLRLSHHRHVHAFSGERRLRVCTLDERPLPLQVDGDYIGEAGEAVFGVIPNGIAVVS